MKTLSFAFLVALYLVITHINCGIESSYLKRAEGGRNGSGVGLVEVHVKPPLASPFVDDEEKGKTCVKNMTRCLQDDQYHQETTKVLSKRLFRAMPPFDLSTVEGVGKQCKRDSRKYVSELRRFELWALKMYDSSAKLPSGLLNGNVNQFGDFDMCLSAAAPDFSGRYCLAAMQFEGPDSPYLSALHRLAHSHFPFRSRLEDPGHRVPRFSSVNWALCVPSSCGREDVKRGVAGMMGEVLEGTEVEVRVEVDEEMCQTRKPEDLPVSTVIVGCVFVGYAVMVAVATMYDFWSIERNNRCVLAFSLQNNLKRLLCTERSASDIEVVHGIRFINAVMLLVAHKCMALFFLPYVNRTEMSEYIGKPWTVVGRAASLYTDPFIMLSGTLTTYSLMNRLQRTNKIDIVEEYTSRLLRIVPTLAALISFCTFILPHMGTGPLWNLVVTQHANNCKQYWWRNMMFIHNYFGFKDMCLTHTHHVGIDTQLFFLSPLVALLLWKWPKRTAVLLVALALLSTVMRYVVTLQLRLSNYIHYGTSIQQLFNTADHMYILPAHRATVYIIGILLGYTLRTHKNMQLSKNQLKLGNLLATFSFFLSFLGPAYMGNIDYTYNPTDAAWYAAYAPILWCFSFAWLIFTSHLGHETQLSRLLSWKGFLLWTRISYTVYLTQFPVFFYNVGRTRSARHFEFFPMLLNFEEFGCIVACSAIMTLLFEMPFQNLRNVIFDKKKEALGKIT